MFGEHAAMFGEHAAMFGEHAAMFGGHAAFVRLPFGTEPGAVATGLKTLLVYCRALKTVRSRIRARKCLLAPLSEGPDFD